MYSTLNYIRLCFVDLFCTSADAATISHDVMNAGTLRLLGKLATTLFIEGFRSVGVPHGFATS